MVEPTKNEGKKLKLYINNKSQGRNETQVHANILCTVHNDNGVESNLIRLRTWLTSYLLTITILALLL